MKALHLTGQRLNLESTYPEPTLCPGEVLIRPTRLGVCGTDLELCQGDLGFEGVLGHEFVGIVEAAADQAGEPWIGRRVVGTINCRCGQCDMCKAGLAEHCRDRTVLGIMGRDGVFAERFTLPSENLLAVPDNVDDDRAVFAEPLAAAFQIPRQLTIEGRPYVTVLGDGPLGLLCAQVMSQLNATVRVIGKYAAKLERCEKWAIKHRLLEEVGLRQDQDIVVDCTGSASGLKTALAMVRPRGEIVMKTTLSPAAWGESAPDLGPLVANEIHVIGSRCGPFPDALEALSAQRVDVLSLITQRTTLARADRALQHAGKPGNIKVLIEA